MKQAILFFLSWSVSLSAATTVVPSGTMRTTPIVLPGVGDGATVEVNAGLKVDGANALEMNNDEQTAINNGTIGTTGGNAIAIRLTGADSLIVNRGAIVTVGAGADGIVFMGNRSQIINDGEISVGGANAQAIVIAADDVSVVNSGTIRSVQAAALDFAGANPALSLRIGSNLQGSVETVDPLALTVQRGLNLGLTLDSGSFGTLSIDVPFV